MALGTKCDVSVSVGLHHCRTRTASHGRLAQSLLAELGRPSSYRIRDRKKDAEIWHSVWHTKGAEVAVEAVHAVRLFFRKFSAC